MLDAWIAGTIVPRFMGPPPPADYDPRDADWFSGEIVISTQQQTSTIPIGGYNPFKEFDREQRGLPRREYRYPKRTLTKRYPFKIERRQLEVILANAGAASPRLDHSSVFDSGERESPPTEPAASARYGSKSQAVHRAIGAHQNQLKDHPDRKSRARFIATIAGCSLSLAEKILKAEGW
jgi:hypothetical protein